MDSREGETFPAKAEAETHEIHLANQAPLGLRWEDHTWWVKLLEAGEEDWSGT